MKKIICTALAAVTLAVGVSAVPDAADAHWNGRAHIHTRESAGRSGTYVTARAYNRPRVDFQIRTHCARDGAGLSWERRSTWKRATAGNAVATYCFDGDAEWVSIYVRNRATRQVRFLTMRYLRAEPYQR